MKIKFLQSVAGDRFSFAPGQIVDVGEVPNGDGPRFLKAGIAIEVREPTVPTKTATAPRSVVKAVTK